MPSVRKAFMMQQAFIGEAGARPNVLDKPRGAQHMGKQGRGRVAAG